MIGIERIESMRTWAEWAQSTVNGLWGDTLHASENGLSIAMEFYDAGAPVSVNADSLAQIAPALSSRICILVHGLCCNERAWSFRPGDALEGETTYAHLLQADLGFSPFSVRYNSGLPIAANGRALCELIDALVLNYPKQVEEIVLVGHSMGGLVLRHACHFAVVHEASWAPLVSHIFYLGTPHDGADLARITAMASDILTVIPNPVTRLIGRILDLRSQGLRDLQHGARLGALSKHHAGAPSAGAASAQGEPIPWLRSAQHCFISGTVTHNPQHLAALVLGDGLVRPVRTSPNWADLDLAESREPLQFRGAVLSGVHHLALMRDPRVYAQIRAWCDA